MRCFQNGCNKEALMSQTQGVLIYHTHLKGLHPSLLLDEFDSCIRLHLHMLPLQFIHETRLIKEICITSQHLRRKWIREIHI